MTSSPRVVVLAGGVGGSKFTLGVREALARRGAPQATVVVNTGDDLWLSGVRLQPDVDSILYALAGVNDTERGWGRAGDTERVNHELQQWDAGWPWFTLGDLDLGTHLARTGWLREGLTPTQVAERLSRRWPLGVRLLPMTDAEVDTRVLVEGGDVMHFQEWWTRHRARLVPRAFENAGMDAARPAPGVIEAIAEADVVLVAPSNPVVSIGPILAVPGVREALAATSARVVGVSPIIGGAVVRGMADVCLAAIGVETSASAVARHYGARRAGGLLDAWLLAEEDTGLAPDVAALGMTAAVAPLWMRDVAASAHIADAALAAAIR
ncbi:2-phospho-L-lactate transferase [Microbacterium sp. zg.Y625]|uniref:2-phospho-L-lactate transferase n=1 Tax=Microbacterium jiangjiandongii TaxID=3049071 RepID=UPI00214B3139|nr:MULTISPECIES: 2-phospho-L-lactate transferase [unclassified Microbacterium]MCR2793408.1 2-phospho-L-lactate transferase [Microbacterium sp. zg.Y625]MCR2815414.1 2-phospho-L-lactate transferase [Microbacterium sp. zg.Y843]WIM25221.1 2-phospho-L-lactate transferase [Microbacterium sp. zg-Y625]